MSRARRLIDLLQELRSRRRPVTAEALAAHLGISVRTLYRDIDALRAQGARIEGQAGFGYVLKPGFLLPPLMLTPEEMEVVLLGASWVARRKDLGMAASARSALAKISAVLPADLADGLAASGLRVGSLSEGQPTRIDPAMIRDALRRERKVRIAYVDASGAESERTLWPVAIGVEADTQVLAAWCELREDYRHFRLDRIRGLEVMPTRMPRRRTAMFKAWRERERACIPEGLTERDVA